MEQRTHILLLRGNGDDDSLRCPSRGVAFYAAARSSAEMYLDSSVRSSAGSTEAFTASLPRSLRTWISVISRLIRERTAGSAPHLIATALRPCNWCRIMSSADIATSRIGQKNKPWPKNGQSCPY